MKKMNSAYRLQIIKEVATRKRLVERGDPMACHISQLLEQRSQESPIVEKNFNGCHYDAQIGGWVSNLWDANK
ncbi:hypothetical protein BIT28_04615 [Photobacterium proteolyticum]|uniref:Uncharacterized protein n=1 Tax=Photobacterium proteolyticum TaxID=1903952 RepID=A0A1Q9GSF3_9GAMM|nr:hypothetical protein [Photobacterium proteolyticum]OLQ77637.1 hypothetical protein BIT28_04615 [Photobacterium proteolyticum]